MADTSELKLALGPAGALGVLALALGLWWRRPLLALAGAAALWADVSRPELGGWRALRETET